MFASGVCPPPGNKGGNGQSPCHGRRFLACLICSGWRQETSRVGQEFGPILRNFCANIKRSSKTPNKSGAPIRGYRIFCCRNVICCCIKGRVYVGKIRIFPIKSLDGLFVEQTQITSGGIL